MQPMKDDVEGQHASASQSSSNSLKESASIPDGGGGEDINIENIVSSCKFYFTAQQQPPKTGKGGAVAKSTFNLAVIAANCSNTKFENRKKLCFVHFKFREPRATLLVFKTGRVIIHTRTFEDIRIAVRKCARKIQKVDEHLFGQTLSFTKPQVQNIVATTELDFNVDTVKLLAHLDSEELANDMKEQEEGEEEGEQEEDKMEEDEDEPGKAKTALPETPQLNEGDLVFRALPDTAAFMQLNVLPMEETKKEKKAEEAKPSGQIASYSGGTDDVIQRMQFQGVVMRLKDPEVNVRVHKSGKLVFFKCKKTEDLVTARSLMVTRLGAFKIKKRGLWDYDDDE